MRYLLAVLALVASAPSYAQYPTRAIRFVVPFPPGGPLDIVARSIAQDLNKAWGQPVATLGAEAMPNTPEAFAAFVKAEMTKYRAIVRTSGAKVD